MIQYHKHKGVMSNGELKSHPISVRHKDPNVQKYHDGVQAVKGFDSPNRPNTVPSKLGKARFNGTPVDIDHQGFLLVDMTDEDCDIQGLRVKFNRYEEHGRKKRTVGLEILKD